VTWRRAAILAAAVVVVVVAVLAVLTVRDRPDKPEISGGASHTTPPATTSTPPREPVWTGTWAAAVQRGTTTFDRRTLRQIIHTTIAGTSARVRLSNAFGTNPLPVRDVHLARSAGAAAIEPGTDRPLTFDGAAGVTIPPGESKTSDPIEFDVPAETDLAISFYLPATDGPATIHNLANRNNYLGDGNQATSETLAGTRKTSSYFFLSGVDVRNPDAEGAVVAFGASVTDGFGSTFGTHRRWTDLLARRLAGSGRTISVLNSGISGNKLTKDGSGQSAVKRFDRDVLAQPGARWVIFSDDPLNDLGDREPPTVDQIVDATRQLIDRGHAAGLKVYCSTLTPFEGAGYWTERGEAGRQRYNEFVRGDGSGCDAVIDQNAATHDPAAPTRYHSGYDSGDHLHPDDSGMRAIADAIDLSLFR
jgi:lysophospholipase L1-like esterase